MIFEINRDFPFQVALSFDEIAMEVLAWLDDRSFEWDMYVDLPASAVRYCFRTAASNTAKSAGEKPHSMRQRQCWCRTMRNAILP
jgi:hypothetical protein